MKTSSILTHRISRFLLLLGCVLFAAVHADATPVSITEDFSATTINANLVAPTGFQFGPNASPVVGRARNTSAVRRYVTTAATDYNTVDFVCEVTMSVNNPGGDNVAFFGFGSGLADTDYFSEPHSSAYLAAYPSDFNSAKTLLTVSSAPKNRTEATVSAVPGPGNGTHRARITKIGNSVTFSVDYNYAGGAFTPDIIVSKNMATDLSFLNSTNSRLFFGVQGSTTNFDNFSVTLIPPNTGGGNPIFFTEDFSATTVNANLVAPTEFRFGLNASPIGKAQNPSGVRRYVKTVSTDYNTVDFISEVTLSVNNSGGENVAFFGFGSGLEDTSYFSEPHTGIYLALYPSDFDSARTLLTVSSEAGKDAGKRTDATISAVPGPGNGTHRARITKIGNVVTLSVDTNYTGGAFTPDISVSRIMVADLPFLNSTNSRLFFGVQGANTTFDDFRVSDFSPDYTVSKTATSIVVTDVSGNSDALTVTEPTPGQIQFGAGGRFFSVNGASSTADSSGAISLSGITSVTVNSGNGSDTVSVGAFIGAMPSLTINGGKGDDTVNLAGDITFAAGASLDVDLQNDDASPGTDDITVAANANLVFSGTGSATLKCSRRITFASGSSLDVVNGAMILEANQQATPTSGNFDGVSLTGATLRTTGTGAVSVLGKSGAGSTGLVFGVSASSSSLITTTSTGAGAGVIQLNGSNAGGYTAGAYGVQVNSSFVASAAGAITVTGTGIGGTGPTGQFNSIGVIIKGAGSITATGQATVTLVAAGGLVTAADSGGIVLSDANSRITAVDGNIMITSTDAGSTSGDSFGGLLQSAASIVTTGVGQITINATGGPSPTASSIGLHVTDASTQISSANGSISITGAGGDAAATRGFIASFGSSVNSTASGSVTINGGAGIGSSFSAGVQMQNTPTTVSTTDGPLVITGTSAGATGSGQSRGLWLTISSLVKSFGIGNITLQGTGGPTSTSTSLGFLADSSGTQITAIGANIQITGNGGVSPLASAGLTGSAGVLIQVGAVVSNSGAGSITMNGTSADTSAVSQAVRVEAPSSVTTMNGDLAITGTGGNGAGGANHGVSIRGDVRAIGGTGNVSITGTAGTPNATNGSQGVQVRGGALVGSDLGNVTLNGFAANTAGNEAVSLAPAGTTGTGTLSAGGTGKVITVACDSFAATTSATVANAGGSIVLRQQTNGTPIGLGATDAPGTLGLTDAELDRLFAPAIIIGDNNSGAITEIEAITRSAPTAVTLNSGAGITLSTGALDSLGGNVTLNPGGTGNTISPASIGVDVTLESSPAGTPGTLSLGSGDKLAIALNSIVPDSGYQRLNVIGNVNVAGSVLALTNGFTPTFADVFSIVAASSLSGSFTNVASGSRLLTTDGSGTFLVTYGTGATPNQVTLSGFHVPDLTPPVLTLPNSPLVVEATGPGGAAVSFSVSANDAIDGPIDMSALTISAISGSTFTLGDHTVNVSAHDLVGNVVNGSFIVRVVDTTAPVVAAHVNVGPIEATSAAGATVTYANANATDAVTLSPTITYSQNSGTVFPLGVTTVTITATDATNNTSTSTFTVTVVDTTAPVIAAHANVGPIEATGPTGATVTYANATATDVVTISPAITYSQNSGTVFPLGDTTVTITAKDAANNTSTSTFTVTVVDTTPPALTVPASPVTASTTSPTGTVVTFSVSATDLVSGAVVPVATPASGSVFPLGNTTVNVTATDAAGNAAQASFTVTVTGIPDIAIEQPEGTAITSGESRSIGSVLVGGSVGTAFTLKNAGAVDLSGLAFTIDGPDSSMFTLLPTPPTLIIPGGATTFTIQFAPTSAGTRTAALHIPSNDPDENPFEIALTGTALSTGIGDVEASFAPGITGTSVTVAMPQPDGKILLAGSFSQVGGQARSNVARILPDGSVDPNFAVGAGVTGSLVNCMALQNDGKILIGGLFTTVSGTARTNIARLNSDFSLDTTFDPGTGPNAVISSMALQPDGKVLIGGQFTTVNGITRTSIARLNSDGTVDSAFDAGSVSASLLGLALQPDGKIVIGGLFISINGTPRNRIARLTATGAVDTTFDPGTGTNNSVNVIALQPDGKLVIGGVFATVNGISRNNIARLESTGALDATFNPGTNGTVRTISAQTDGKLLIGGLFTRVATILHPRLARVTAAGELDLSFDPGSGPNNSVQSVVPQVDGKVLVAGQFSSVNGISSNLLVRLTNNAASESLTVPSAARVQWLRGGSSPEVASVDFEQSTDAGLTWTSLGSGTRNAGGWERTGLTLGIGTIRARGQRQGGIYGGSGGLVESSAAFSFPTPIQTWRQQFFGSVANTGNGADTNDFDHDGLTNLIEYAFGLDPLHNSAGQLPQSQIIAGNLVMSFTQPAGVSGITYQGEFSTTMQADDWHSVSDTGTGSQHTFSVPMVPSRTFLRVNVTSLP